jgi:cytochrome c
MADKMTDRMSQIRFVRNAASAVVLLSGLGAAATPSSAADVELGGQLARQWCASCHVLPNNPGQTALQGPPSFRAMARGKTADQLKVFLMNPHGAMPPLTLSRVEIDNLVAYIETLR